MRIANPIYDVFFKYLMEDTEIAKRLLSTIINEEIIELDIRPQEQFTRSEKFDIIILRLDFRAIIQLSNGEKKKVLIELQKGKKPGDISRFRRYLADNYRKQDEIKIKQKTKKVSLPILTIYFLGFNLRKITSPVLKVNREYIDLSTMEKLLVKEAFIEQLSHDSFVIQIRKLKQPVRSELERVLQIFNQTYITSDKKILEISENTLQEHDLLHLMAERLRAAASDEGVLRKAELEEEVEETIDSHIREKQELAEENTELQKENSELSDKNSELSDKNNDLLREIEELKKRLKDNK